MPLRPRDCLKSPVLRRSEKQAARLRIPEPGFLRYGCGSPVRYRPDSSLAQSSGLLMTSPIRIGIAVIESAGRILVGRRSASVPLPGRAEFPGGKCEADETPRSCAVRECREETGLLIVPREHLATVEHSYEHADVELHFWKCGLSPGLPDQATATSPFRWVTFEELATLDFPAANKTVIEQLLAE